jgi:asparagine synthase (glutamine-hydrolysing)
VKSAVNILKHRGPDAQGIVHLGDYWLGHTRLAILDPDPRSNQPFLRDGIAVAYNGELWNYRTLRETLRTNHEQTFATSGDTEVIAAALQTWGAEALPKLEGMFAVAWTDGRSLWLARDRFGEVPLHRSLRTPSFASELRGLREMATQDKVGWVEPGWVYRYDGPTLQEQRRWYDVSAEPIDVKLEEASCLLRDKIASGVQERSISDVPVCALLSGGIDSTAVLYHLRKHRPELVTYIAVHDDKSPDLTAAREAAGFLEVELREVRVPAPMADDLAEVVRCIEMPHKAQVEIGWACLHLARRMRSDGFRVTYSGEGSDELWASYGFSYHGVKADGWHPYRKKIFVAQHRKNFARCNKVFMAHGVECRLPFLHTPLVELALSLPETAVRRKGKPKAVLCEAYRGLVPDRVVNRAKVAFQDGTGLKKAAAKAVADPKRFYMAEFKQLER